MNYNLLWLLAYLLAWTEPGEGILHTESMTTFSETVKNNSYFGYSITYESTSKQLIVSAPAEDKIGVIFSCELSTAACKKLSITLGHVGIRPDHKRWLGATVKAGPSYFVTCAPLFLNKIHDLIINGTDYSKKYGTFSRCFKYDTKTSATTILKSISLEEKKKHAKLLEHAMDSFGWSIDVDDEDVIIGGPAMSTGRAIKYILSSKPTARAGLPISLTGFQYENNLDSFERRVDYNFGYSVVVGHFISGDESKTYAIGSPYGKEGQGMIVFYKFTSLTAYRNGVGSSEGDLRNEDENAVGSMFGAVLGVARLTAGSRATSLLVGAPTYATSQQVNRGAVYFYKPATSLPLKTYFRKIVGAKDKAYFGSAIARLGDYNGDGLDEIAIAAPYENIDEGVVYIYSSKDVISDKGDITWIQRIRPAPGRLVKSFGASLASIQDYDDNGCNELVIGAPVSNIVTYIRCIASVKAVLHAEIPKDLSLRKDNPSRTNDQFYFTSCLNLKYPEKPHVIYAKIRITVRIDHPDAKLKEESDKSYEVNLVRNQTVFCKNITVSAPSTGKFQYPVKYNLSATQVDPPENDKEFNAAHVRLNDLSLLSVAGNIWLTECKNVSNCMPFLKLTKSLSVSPEKPYVLGTPKNVTLSWSVTNEGEAAYGACVRVSLPESLSVAGRVPSGCTRLDRHHGLKCLPPRALRKEDPKWDIPDIQLDLSRLTSKHKSTFIRTVLDVDCSDEELNGGEEVPIPLKPDYSNIFVKGITDSGVSNIVNMSVSDVEGKTFEHSYTITSGALTNWVEVDVEIVVQNRSFIEYSPIMMVPEPQCSESSNKSAFILHCKLDELNSQIPTKFTIPMKIISPELLDIAMKGDQNTQLTSVKLKLNEKIIEDSVTTSIGLGDQVKIWIVVVASLVGLLILLLIFFALTKCGFFKRNKKQKLENVRRSVRRQTMMRKTMMEGVRVPPGGDRQSLLASVPHETAEEAAARDHRLRLDSNATRRK